MTAFDHDVAEHLGLLRAGPPETDELEQGQQGHHQLGAAPLGAHERREEQ